MKDHNLSAKVLSAGQGLQPEDSSAQKREEAHKAVSGEPRADELATALAMMHATLESTTDAILVTDETNYVREFNEKYVKFWGIPPHMLSIASSTFLSYRAIAMARRSPRFAIAPSSTSKAHCPPTIAQS
jgi:PAS domain-containing protein